MNVKDAILLIFITQFLKINSTYRALNLGLAKPVNCNQILGHVADQDYIEFIDQMINIACKRDDSRGTSNSYIQVRIQGGPGGPGPP